jgi:IS4 transposase
VIPGEPVSAKMVVSRVLSEAGEVLAQWLILTNMKHVDASTIALRYYWRWQIECFFKLFKSAGHHLESWQQESALAIAKRLLVVSMACVTVWQIAADKSQKT